MSERAERTIILTNSYQVKLAQVSEQDRHGERSHWDELARDERPYDRRRPQDRPRRRRESKPLLPLHGFAKGVIRLLGRAFWMGLRNRAAQMALSASTPKMPPASKPILEVASTREICNPTLIRGVVFTQRPPRARRGVAAQPVECMDLAYANVFQLFSRCHALYFTRSLFTFSHHEHPLPRHPRRRRPAPNHRSEGHPRHAK